MIFETDVTWNNLKSIFRYLSGVVKPKHLQKILAKERKKWGGGGEGGVKVF
jgi:hypothetical protein